MLAVVPAGLRAQAATGSISGIIRDSLTGVPVRAVFEILGTDLRTGTDAAGRFTIAQVPPGTHTAAAWGIALQPKKMTIRVLPNTETNLGTLELVTTHPREVWFRCRAFDRQPASGVQCDSGHSVPAPYVPPFGVGVVSTQITWDTLWQKYHGPDPGKQDVDWGRWMVVLIPCPGGMTDHEGIDRYEFNHALFWPDSVVVVLGPDSLFRRVKNDADGIRVPPVLGIAIPRSDARVVFRSRLHPEDSAVAVDWDALAHWKAANEVQRAWVAFAC